MQSAGERHDFGSAETIYAQVHRCIGLHRRAVLRDCRAGALEAKATGHNHAHEGEASEQGERAFGRRTDDERETKERETESERERERDRYPLHASVEDVLVIVPLLRKARRQVLNRPDRMHVRIHCTPARSKPYAPGISARASGRLAGHAPGRTRVHLLRAKSKPTEPAFPYRFRGAGADSRSEPHFPQEAAPAPALLERPAATPRPSPPGAALLARARAGPRRAA